MSSILNIIKDIRKQKSQTLINSYKTKVDTFQDSKKPLNLVLMKSLLNSKSK